MLILLNSVKIMITGSSHKKGARHHEWFFWSYHLGRVETHGDDTFEFDTRILLALSDGFV